MSPPYGVLAMSYGTPGGPDQVAGYYTHVRGGRPPTPEALADLQRRYRAIGGVSPLAERTRDQARGLEAELARRQPGRWQVFLGAKHAPPFIEDGVAAMAAAGVRRGVAVVLAPHYSALSVGEYLERATASAKARDLHLETLESWHVAPGLVGALAARLEETLATLPAGMAGSTEVLITAHSLPARVLAMGDPYPDQVRATGEAVTARAGVTRWRVAWQSAGRTPEPWLGPDILEVIRRLPAEGIRAVVVCPVGFTSDHLEVLYDVDIEARQVAEEAGLALARTPSLNDDPRLLATLAGLVTAALPGSRD